MRGLFLVARDLMRQIVSVRNVLLSRERILKIISLNSTFLTRETISNFYTECAAYADLNSVNSQHNEISDSVAVPERHSSRQHASVLNACFMVYRYKL